MEYFLLAIVIVLILALVWVIRTNNSPNKKKIPDENQIRTLLLEKAVLEERLENQKEVIARLEASMAAARDQLEAISKEKQDLFNDRAELLVHKNSLLSQIQQSNDRLKYSEEKKEEIFSKYIETKERLTKSEETNKYLSEKLDKQTGELEEIGKRFTDQFELLANKILEDKSKKFTVQNRENIKNILDPIHKEFDSFKQKVQETYDKESKERFSLEFRVKELVLLNKQISEDAKNLTNALKGNAKTRGNWGEAILETILQNSGLEKGRHYETQSFLKSESGDYLLGPDGKRMQPDVIINYPDDRKVIIDAKVSMNAYERFFSEPLEQEQQGALLAHLKSIRNHIDQLSSKQYEGYARALDFVIMFVPIEAAYIQAVQADPQLWEYAYKKRVLLISSSNLIAALKMIKDLWVRDDQTKNAIEIAERGGKLYDKFVRLIQSVEDIGKHLDKSRESHNAAMKQLKSGNGNLIGQVEKLKTLGANAKSSVPDRILDKNPSDID